MNILNRLTIKHLKMNPKRTIVTIIGIVLSMALMLGCGLLASSFIESMKEETIATSGSYHVSFADLSSMEAGKIENNINVERSYYYSVLGFADFSESQNESKPYYYVTAASDDLLKTFSLEEGRLPENENEIVLSEHILTNALQNISVGDYITLSIGTRFRDGDIEFNNSSYEEALEDHLENRYEKTYQVVGIVARPYTENYSAAGYSVFTKASSLMDHTTLFVEYHKPKDTFEISIKIRDDLELHQKGITYNSSLLYYYGTTRYGNINRSIMSVLCFALGLLSIGCIIVIYNSFAISTMERKKQFGLYASIGATRKQILHTVFFEAFLVGTIGIVLGIFGSFLGIYIVLQILNYLLASFWNYEFHLVIQWMYILVPIFFMILVIFFSAFLPARRASRVSPIVAIRENDDIKMPRRKLKTPKFVTFLFGIEGELALKNMKRNKRKYRITVLSLFVSIVLFVSFSTYLNYGIRTMDAIDQYDFDITIEAYGKDGFQTLKNIQSDSRVETSYLFSLSSYPYQADYNNYVAAYQSYINQYEKNEIPINFFVLEDEDFDRYASRFQASRNDFLLVNQGQVVTYENGNRETYQGKFFQKEINSMTLCRYVSSNENVCDISISNIKMVLEAPETFKYTTLQPVSSIFLSRSNYESVFSKYIMDMEVVYNLNIQSKEYESLYQEFDELYGKNMNIASPKIEMKEEQNIVLAIKILLYGFISLVTLIGVTSVFNTIHTSINLRRKEFAMLRSMGLTPKGFNKMILFESLFFGLKSLVYGLPVSFLCVLYIHNSMSGFSIRDHVLFPWGSVCFTIIGVFAVVLFAMRYSVHKIRKENILNAIRDENI